MKRLLSLAIGAICIFSLAVQPLAKGKSRIALDTAKEAAWKMAPASCAYITTDTEMYLFEVKFYDKTAQEKYTVQVGASTGNILQVTIQSAFREWSDEVKTSDISAAQAIRARYSDAVSVTAQAQEKDGKHAYRVDYQTPYIVGTAWVNAETSKIMEREDVYFQAKNEELRDVVKTTATSDSLLRRAVDAQTIEKSAREAVPGGEIDRLRLTGDRKLYEVKMHKGDYEYDLLFNAETGERLNLSVSFDPVDFLSDWYQNPGTVEKQSPRFGMAQIQSPSAVKSTGTEGTYISREKAKQIAMRSAPSGAKVKSMSLKHEGGKTYYEGWLRLDGMLYGFQIDAVSGSVINWDTKIDESWDPGAHHDVDSEKDDDTDYGDLKMDDID